MGGSKMEERISGRVNDKEEEQQRLIKTKKQCNQPAVQQYLTCPGTILQNRGVKEWRSVLTLSGTIMLGRTREGDMSMVFLCFGLCLSRSLCFWAWRLKKKEKQISEVGQHIGRFKIKTEREKTNLQPFIYCMLWTKGKYWVRRHTGPPQVF